MKQPKQPAFLFYIGDWLKDPAVIGLAPAARGIWIDLLCAMHELDRSGQISGTAEQLARVARCTPAEFAQAITEFQFARTADITERDGVYTIINRRMKREYRERNASKRRVAVYREKGGGNPERWNAIRVKILIRDDYKCAYCGRKAGTVDHIIPRCQGGGEDDLNLCACCYKCNASKNGRTPEQAGMPWPKMKSNGESNAPPSVSVSSSLSTEEGKPTHPALTDVQAWAQMIGCPPDEAERFWNHFEASGWIDKNGHAIVNARAKLATWAADARARPLERAHHASRPSTLNSQPSTSVDLIHKQETLKRVEAALDTLRKQKPDHGGPEFDRWLAKLRPLKEQRKTLLHQLGFPEV